MLRLRVKTEEGWNNVTEEFIPAFDVELKLEHSLVSISRWESIWHVPFLNTTKTPEQSISYVKCMTMNDDLVPDDIYNLITDQDAIAIKNYIDNPMTATKFSNLDKDTSGSKIITSEELYYYMTALNIPSEYEHWHLNRLITLITICSEKSKPPKKMSKQEIYAQNAARNAQRKKELGIE